MTPNPSIHRSLGDEGAKPQSFQRLSVGVINSLSSGKWSKAATLAQSNLRSSPGNDYSPRVFDCASKLANSILSAGRQPFLRCSATTLVKIPPRT